MTDFIWSLRFVAAFDLDINTWLYKLLNNDQQTSTGAMRPPPTFSLYVSFKAFDV